MKSGLRDAWTKLIRAEDYDAHMAAVGQAQANAALLAGFFERDPPRAGSAVLFAGAGTGQLFDDLSPEFVNPYRATFSDINAEYLKRLAARLSGNARLKFATVVDDIEASQLHGAFELVVAILLLEHVEWRKAIAEMCRLASHRVLVVLQENPANMQTAMTRSRLAVGTMRVFTELNPHLVPQSEVVAEFARNGFTLQDSSAREVLDAKKMVALEFEKRR
jgi:ubiquinone/menaquinone biosynthesis C-methylase UbiE